ncbi:MAG: hypothetical protein HFF17_07135 [Oscillospiraceae bacterium]|nr:hypothetical protein [Oscillospiraceae bacterium]
MPETAHPLPYFVAPAENMSFQPGAAAAGRGPRFPANTFDAASPDVILSEAKKLLQKHSETALPSASHRTTPPGIARGAATRQSVTLLERNGLPRQGFALPRNDRHGKQCNKRTP